MKRKTFSILLALVLVLTFSLVTAVPVAAQTTYNVIPFTLDKTGGNTSEWSTEQFNTGTHSVKLTHIGGAGIRAYVQFTPPTGITLAEFVAAPATYGFSYWRTEDKIGPQLELTFTDGSDGWVELTAEVALYDYITDDLTGQWIDKTLSATEQCQFFGDDSEDTAFNSTGLGDLSALTTDIVAATTAVDTVASVGAWEMTKVIVDLGWSGDTQTAYIDDIIIAGVTYHGHIGNTIAIATAGDTVVVAAGTYTEDLDIPATKTNLELAGATGAKIKGVATFPGPFPDGIPNIEILASGVKIHGFTLEGPAAAADRYSMGMYIGAANVEIYDNAFLTHTQAAGQYSVVIQTYRKVVLEGVDLSGLNIHDNTFDDLGDGAVGYDGIYVNIDAGTGLASIVDNDFVGNIFRAISAERSNVVISGNSIITDLPPWTSGFAGGYQGMFIGCFPLSVDPFVAGPVQTDVSITGNTVKGATTSDGFVQGIRVGHSSQLGLDDITVLRNTIQYNNEGIAVKALADATPVDVVVNYNYIVGNTLGVKNYGGTTVELDAQYNWWGGVAGPDHSTNPYQTEAGTGNQENDSVSNDVDFLPWMIHDTLVAGWNIWSTPIAAATGYEDEPDTNTVVEALDFWTADSSKVIDAYCFNSATQAWVVPTSLTPLQAVYLNLSASATIDVCVSDSNYAPPGRTMHLGWNLVGTADWDDDKLVNVALDAAFYGTGAVNLEGYQYVISPSIHQTSWTFTRGGTATAKYFVPTCGYWVYMVNQGVLNGFTYTPIAP